MNALVFFSVLWVVNTFIVYKFGSPDFSKTSFFSGFIIALTIWLFFSTILTDEYKKRCDNLIESNIELFEPHYESRYYCYLTEENYTENRELIIETVKYPYSPENEFSRNTFYRLDVVGHNNTPFISYWVNEKNLNIIIEEGTIPHLKIIDKYFEKEPPILFKMFLPEYRIGIPLNDLIIELHLPYQPIYKKSNTPEFLEFDFLKFLKNE